MEDKHPLQNSKSYEPGIPDKHPMQAGDSEADPLAPAKIYDQDQNALNPKKNNQQTAETNSIIEQNKHQNLAAENVGFEPEETERGNLDSPYKLKHTLDDKRPEDSGIEKGWTVDSNTSRGPQDQKSDDPAGEPIINDPENKG